MTRFPSLQDVVIHIEPPPRGDSPVDERIELSRSTRGRHAAGASVPGLLCPLHYGEP